MDIGVWAGDWDWADTCWDRRELLGSDTHNVIHNIGNITAWILIQDQHKFGLGYRVLGHYNLAYNSYRVFYS